MAPRRINSRSGTFANSTGTPTSPTAPTLRTVDPDGTVVDTVGVIGAVGVATATVMFTKAGKWRARWVGSGAVTTTSPILVIDVQPSL